MRNFNYSLNFLFEIYIITIIVFFTLIPTVISQQQEAPYFDPSIQSCVECQKNYSTIDSCTKSNEIFKNFTSVLYDPLGFIEAAKCACLDTFLKVYPLCVECFQATNQQNTTLNADGIPPSIDYIRNACAAVASITSNSSTTIVAYPSTTTGPFGYQPKSGVKDIVVNVGINGVRGVAMVGDFKASKISIGNFLDCNVPTTCKFSKKIFQDNYNIPAPKVISGGGNHSALITYNGELWMTGSDIDGQFLTDKKWKFVACGWAFTILVEENGNVYSFGKGLFGELGCGENNIIINKSKKVESISYIEKVVCGLRHCIALTKDGSCYGWGSNKFGQLGLGNDSEEISQQLGKKQPNTYYSPKNIVIFNDCYNYDNNGLFIIDVACGQNHTAVLTSKGEIYTFGLNKYGQLGYASPLSIRNCEIPRKPIPLCYLPKSSPILPKGFKVKTIECGSEHSLVLSIDGQCISWGWNEHGNCGVGNNNDQWSPVKLIKFNKDEFLVEQIGSGCGNSWIWAKKKDIK
ncbi:10344_t:CDS:2 [Entrophospora sp. SA101]|nr:10344_t:CDS:2 [Entrophospora sp. SA101]